MKVPAGNIPLSEAFQTAYERLYADAPPIENFQTAYRRLQEERRRSDSARKKFEKAFTSGRLEARVHDGARELTITPEQWKDTCASARAFFGGPIEDCHDGPLAEYRGLFPYTNEAAFDEWVRSRDNSETPKTAGRPSSMRIVMAELERRREGGLCKLSRAAEARALAEWLKEAHPDMRQLTPKAIRNKLPPDFQPYKAPK